MTVGRWAPASGYKTKSGVEMWRVWNLAAEPHEAQLEDARGRPKLYRSRGAAQEVADRLNAGYPPDGPPLTFIERRLLAGATVMKTSSEDAPLGCFWTFTDTGRAARADIIEKLIAAGRLKPRGDGLFADDGQTWAYA